MADELTAEVVETVAETLEEAADVTRTITGKDVTVFLVGLAGGITIGYFFARKRLETKYSKISEEEISEMREHYRQKAVAAVQKPDVEELGKMVKEHLGYDPVEARKREIEAIEEVERDPSEIVVVEPEAQNVFAGSKPDSKWDYASEVKNRNPDRPYIIHIDEFQQNEPEHEQTTYTYFEVDEVLTDTRDEIITQIDYIIGKDNLQFGHGSNDVNVVYIRNDKLSLDIEVLKTPGSYSEEVAGFVRHSDEKIPRRQRRFDDE